MKSNERLDQSKAVFDRLRRYKQRNRMDWMVLSTLSGVSYHVVSKSHFYWGKKSVEKITAFLDKMSA